MKETLLYNIMLNIRYMYRILCIFWYQFSQTLIINTIKILFGNYINFDKKF